MKKLAKTLGVLLLLGFLGFAGLVWIVNQPPVDLTRLQQLRPGMSQAEVREILGAPNSEYANQWAYYHFIQWPIVYVRFDQSGKFTNSEYDY